MKAPGDGPEQVLGAGKDCGDTPASRDWVCTGHVRDREGKFRQGSEILVCRGSCAGMGCCLGRGLGIFGESGLKHETTFAFMCSFEWGRID